MSTFPATNSNEAVELVIDGGNQLHQIINEDATTEIQTESGPIPSVRKALADTFLFQDPIPWDQGSDEISFNQLRTFDSNIYWAPSATLASPVPMGTTPIGDSNWGLAPVSISKEYVDKGISKSQSSLLGQTIFTGDNEKYVEDGDDVPLNTFYLQVQTVDGVRVVSFSPVTSGTVTSLTETSAVIGGTPVTFSLANHVVIVNVSDMVKCEGLKENDYITTHKFNTYINQKWIIESSADPDEFTIALQNGLYAKEISDVKYFESFGAYADGVTLDNTAFDFAKNYSGTVHGKPSSIYTVDSSFALVNNSRWKGNWGKIRLEGTTYFTTVGSDCYLGEFELDGLDEDHTAYPVSIATPSINAKIGDMIYRNFHGKTSTQTYPLKIPAYGAKNFSVGNQKFFNILQDDDGAVTGKGFVGGIYLVGVDAEVPLGKSYGAVGDVYGEVVKSVDTGSGVVQDSDLVRLFAETASTENFDITFGNIIGRNVYKRIVKGASIPGVKFGDVWSFNPEDGAESYTLFAVVECLSTARNLKFGDIYCEGPTQRTVWIKGNGNKCGDVFDGSGSQCVLFGGPSDPAISCQTGNIIGRGLNDNSPQGTAVTLFNADKCQTGNITGLFAISLATNEENVGHNIVGDITCNGRLDAIYGFTTIGNIDVDITTTSVAGSHFILGMNAKLSNSEIVTDGRVTMSVIGSNIDVNLGKVRIIRVSSANGIESNHSVFTTASAVNGTLRGELEIEVNAAVLGTPTGSSGKTLAYFTGLNVDNLDLSMKVTAPTRGATGLHCWFNNVDGQINRLAVKSAMDIVGSQLNGKLGISKLEYLVGGGASVVCTDEVNIGFTEKEATATVTGANFNPNVVNSTR